MSDSSTRTSPVSEPREPSLTPKAIEVLVERTIEHCLQEVGISDKLRTILTHDHGDLAASFTRHLQTQLEQQTGDAATIAHDLSQWLDQHQLQAKPSGVSLEEARALLLEFFRAVVTTLVDGWLPKILGRLATSMAMHGINTSTSTMNPAQSLEPEDYLTVLSSLPYQALREALYKRSFEKVEDSPWPTAKLDKGSVRGHAQLRPPGVDTTDLVPPETLDQWILLMWNQHKELSDIDADALDILSSIWINQARRPQDYALADVDDILTMRGVQKKRGGQGRRGGYEAKQRTEILRAISHIQNIWLNIVEADIYEDSGGGRRKPTQMAIQSRSFIITDRIGQLRLDGYMDVHRFFFQPGKVFAHFLFGPGRQTALLSAKALQYEPFRQRWEKRLARYLSWQWRTKARQSDYARPYKVSTLMDAVGEHVDAHDPGRTRARLERALDVLKSDSVVAGWQYDRWDEDHSSRHGWITHWLQATILIDPPETIRRLYQTLEIHKKAEANLLPPVASLGEQIRRRRKELGLSQLKVAEQLGITQGYLSRLEAHPLQEKRLSDPMKTRLLDWLRTTDLKPQS